MRIAVIIATYNRPDALAVVLDGYAHQDDKNFEVIVAAGGGRRKLHTQNIKKTKATPFMAGSACESLHRSPK